MTLSPRLRRTRRIALLLAITAYLLSYFHRIAPAAISTELATSFHTKAASLWSFVKDYPPTPITHKALQENVIQRPSWIKELFTVLRNSATWPGFFFNIGVAGSFFSFAGLWAGPYLMQAHGFSKIVASNHISLYFIGFAVGSIVIGRMSDYIGRRKPLLLGGSFLYSLSWLIWIFGKGLPLPITYLTFVFMGLMTSCFTLSWSCAKEVNPPALSGMATSVVNTGMFLGTAIMQPIFGWILDHYWLGIMSGSVRMYSEENFRMGLWFLFVCSLLSTFVGFLIKETYCRNVWTSLESGYKGGQQ